MKVAQDARMRSTHRKKRWETEAKAQMTARLGRVKPRPLEANDEKNAERGRM